MSLLAPYWYFRLFQLRLSAHYMLVLRLACPLVRPWQGFATDTLIKKLYGLEMQASGLHAFFLKSL